MTRARLQKVVSEGTNLDGNYKLTPNENQLADGEDNLEENKCSPLPVTLGILETVTDQGADQVAQVPQAVVDSGKTSAVERVDDFGKQHGRGQLGERVAETENETTGAEHWSG